MKYDVFISYSSKNAPTAQAICHELEDNGIRCWMAPRDIPVGSKYATVITQAIKECKAVVLVFSEQSAISPWVESEINIAFSNRKPIIPYKIDLATLENYDEFYLMLNNRHWIESYPDFKTRFSELVSVVSSLVGSMPVDQKVGVTSISKIYKAGDYYDDGVKQGVVFDVWDGGRHGKIVSLDQAELLWSNVDVLVGAVSEDDGNVNTDKIMSLANKDEYPAFEWCRSKGRDWYLPAINELKLLLLNTDVRNAVNQTLKQQGCTLLVDFGWFKYYWSSTEVNEFCAWIVSVSYGDTGIYDKLSNYYSVRAVATF